MICEPMGEITLTLPAAPPEVYLMGVRWWREASGRLWSAATGGGGGQVKPGIDPVADLIDIEVPKRIESQARRAVRQGLAEVEPVLRMDVSLAREATQRSRSRWEMLRSLEDAGVPKPDPRVVDLQDRARRVTDEALGPAADS
jgi:hypothetical protein